MAEKRRGGSSQHFFFLFPMYVYLLEKRRKPLNMSSLYVLYTFVCVCVLRFHCERGFSEKWTRPLIFRWRGSIKKDFNPPFASLSVYRRDFFSPGSIWTKRLERPERKKKAHGWWKGTKRTFDTLSIILEESFKNVIHVFRDSYEYNPSFHPSSIVQKSNSHQLKRRKKDGHLFEMVGNYNFRTFIFFSF